eukprot:gene26296-biopygen15635
MAPFPRAISEACQSTKTSPIELRVEVHHLREAKMVYRNSQLNRSWSGFKLSSDPFESVDPTPAQNAQLHSECSEKQPLLGALGQASEMDPF